MNSYLEGSLRRVEAVCSNISPHKAVFEARNIDFFREFQNLQLCSGPGSKAAVEQEADSFRAHGPFLENGVGRKLPQPSVIVVRSADRESRDRKGQTS